VPRDLSRLDAEDHKWLAAVPARLLRRAPEPPSGRFNAGQKLNYLLICILLAVLLITGIDTVLAGDSIAYPLPWPTIIPQGAGNGVLRLTTARYFTPSGRSIQVKGITPDIAG